MHGLFYSKVLSKRSQEKIVRGPGNPHITPPAALFKFRHGFSPRACMDLPGAGDLLVLNRNLMNINKAGAS